MSVHERFINADRPIVVGIDGSPAAVRALAWAVHEAHARNCPVLVIHAWDTVPLPGAMFTGPDQRHCASECFLANEVAAAIRNLAHPPEISQLSVKGAAARILIEHSRDAALLVVGRSRNHRAAKDLLPGSVSAACVRAATCPVLVVPEYSNVVDELHDEVLVGGMGDR